MALFITRFANAHLVDAWEEAFRPMPFNRFEGAALQVFLEGYRQLLVTRDAVDELRNQHPWSGKDDPNHTVTHAQQMALYRVTDAYFGDFYGVVSKLSGLVARNSAVFRVNFSDNGPFLRWAEGRVEPGHRTFQELESARLFRALLAHPQQFPPYTWATVVDSKNLTQVVLWGEKGRGRNPIPRGATTKHVLEHGDWQFQAPDEVSVTNALGTLAEEILTEILIHYSSRRSFARRLSRSAARDLVHPEIDVSASRRSVGSNIVRDRALRTDSQPPRNL